MHEYRLLLMLAINQRLNDINDDIFTEHLKCENTEAYKQYSERYHELVKELDAMILK